MILSNLISNLIILNPKLETTNQKRKKTLRPKDGLKEEFKMDVEKPFDSVAWDFLYKVMEKCGFHEKFIK